jgi:serine/threonine-protein kinase
VTQDGIRSEAEQGDPTSIAHFRIQGRLGQGGMGVVYRAEDETLRRTVALKLLPDTGGDTEARQRFLREARSAAAITHPNVAIIHHVGEADGRLYIAMELVPGENLRARLARGRVDLATVRDLAGQIARGLAAAHEKGIVHRDLKPENVMITPDGVVKLLDFGLAKLGTERMASGPTEVGLAKTETLVTSDQTRVLGTAEYMSPEQALGRPVDVQSDVFSFGVVLYEMLSGTRPFHGLTTSELLVAIARDAPAPLRMPGPEADATVEAIVGRCLAKEPGERFASAGEIVAALSGRVPVANVRAVRSGAHRRRSRTLGVAALLLAAVVAAVVIARTATRHPVAPAASVPAPVTLHATTMTDLPPLPTKVPEAAAEYAQTMQAWHDASIEQGMKHLLHVVQLDPSFALAHLMLAVAPVLSTEEQRKHLTAAVELRGQLGDRDAAILEITQARLGRDKPDVEDDMRRWKALADRYPLDAFIVYMAEMYCLDAGRKEEAFALLHRALALDPRFALPLFYSARFQEEDGDLDEALATTNRCLALAPSAAWCLETRVEIEARLGQCAKLEEDAHQMIAIEPDSRVAYEWLATAFVARGAPGETLAEAFRRAREHSATPLWRAFHEVLDPVKMAWDTGDFTGAVAAMPALDAFVAGQTSDRVVSEAVEYEVSVLVEMGRADRAADVAEAHQQRVPVLTPDDPGVGHSLGLALWTRHLAGRVPRPELRAARESFARDVAARLPPRLANNVWFDFYAQTAVTAADARDALEALPRYSPLPTFESAVDHERMMGQVLLLAGRVDDAVPHLRRAARSCYGCEYTLSHQTAARMLGEALEQKGDRAGACEAYAEVLAHWGRARPRSVTADEARAHARAIGCALHDERR